MKIAHIGLASMFTEYMSYQDNLLSEQNVCDGHEVIYIADTFCYQNGAIIKTQPEDRILTNGVRLIRLPYVKMFNDYVTGKIRKVRGLYTLLEEFSPDVIMCHSLGFWSILDVIRYKKEHPNVKFYADSHAASYNSGRNWLSLHVLHRCFYKYLIQKAIPYLEKFFYIGEDERLFALKNYGVPESLMEFYPLGGIIFPDAERQEKRERRRAELGLAPDELLLVHAGKLDALKRTDELLRAFAAVPELKAKLAVIGSIPEDRKELLTSLMEQDNRIQYLGWKSGAELQEYLCACDLYCQPGSRSAIMQNAVCCSCAVLCYPHEIYISSFDYGNILWVRTEGDMVEVFRRLAENASELDTLKENSGHCARELLDYRKLAARLYE